MKKILLLSASEYVDNLIYAAGIQSPGLASAFQLFPWKLKE